MTRTRFVLVGAGAAWMACAVVSCGWFDSSDLQRYSPPGAVDATTDGTPPSDSAANEAAADADAAPADGQGDREITDAGNDVEDVRDATENDAPVDAGEDVD